MGKLVFGMMQSLDGYVDHRKLGPPRPALSRHFLEHMRDLTGCLYGRRMYEVMRYWDDDGNVEGAEDQDFATAWRSKPKWIASHSLRSVGPNATLVEDDLEAFVRELKAKVDGE
ncbi:MAG TPA: hypothetical protein VJQ83_08420, partial [Tepidiformaceae bacterium]|nr:hypothetical protein [Tepidiformaceae bacterium]